MKSAVTSLTRNIKLDIKNHGLNPGYTFQGVWQDHVVEFEYQGDIYIAFTQSTVGTQRRLCRISFNSTGAVVAVIEPPPPRKHYYDEDGDPQYQGPPALLEQWAQAARSTHQSTVINALYAVQQAGLAGLPSPTQYPATLVKATEELYRDFIQQGFFPQEFPLLFHDLPDLPS